MKKISSLFARNYDGDRQVRDEVVPGSEWVQLGEGVATVKIDGTSCMMRGGKLYKRYDRKEDRPAPEGWEACEDVPNEHTGHWPGWVPVTGKPDDKWHVEGLVTAFPDWEKIPPPDGTYELVGPKVQGNLYGLTSHELRVHGGEKLPDPQPPRTFVELKTWFEANAIEGIVWHHSDGRMVKIKRRDFGLPWGKWMTKFHVSDADPVARRTGPRDGRAEGDG